MEKDNLSPRGHPQKRKTQLMSMQASKQAFVFSFGYVVCQFCLLGLVCVQLEIDTETQSHVILRLNLKSDCLSSLIK